MCKNFLSLEKYLEIGFFICENSNYAEYSTLNNSSIEWKISTSESYFYLVRYVKIGIVCIEFTVVESYTGNQWVEILSGLPVSNYGSALSCINATSQRRGVPYANYNKNGIIFMVTTDENYVNAGDTLCISGVIIYENPLVEEVS